MKNFIIFAAFLFAGSIWFLNAQTELRNPTQENRTILKNPTENNEFNTNAVPFDEKVQDSPRMDLNKFGNNERRNISVQQGDYNHYNQKSTHNQSIVSDIDRTQVNRPQSATLTNDQFQYDQNSGRKVSSNTTATTNPTYNSPMRVNGVRQNSEIAATDDQTIQTGLHQGISVSPDDGSSNTDTPIAPGGNPENPTPDDGSSNTDTPIAPGGNPENPTPDDGPIGDAIPFLVLIAGIYAFIQYRKQ